MSALAEPELAEVDVAIGPMGLLELRRRSEQDWPEWATVRFPPNADIVEFTLPEDGAPWTEIDCCRLTVPAIDLFLEASLGPITLCWSADGGDSIRLDLRTLVVAT